MDFDRFRRLVGVYMIPTILAFFVIKLVTPVALGPTSSPFERAFAVVTAAFFCYIFFRSARVAQDFMRK